MKQLWAPWRLEYVQHADDGEECVFCRAAGLPEDEPELVIRRGELAFVLLNKFPYASGHLMVAPYRHGASFDDLEDGETLEVQRLAVDARTVLISAIAVALAVAASAAAVVLGRLISLVTNLAAGLGDPLDHEEVLAVGKASATRMGELLAELIPRL